ncbi:MAG: 5-bromo-4-chloroindolyl phosphate hydrolysis family protein [Geminicoccaceae bacterium]|nr:5-bromo-4-chloroindolyl phosphate hydrolysis family protein [Geminicoccaceae bacterium]MCB9967206.1 5-bromo-4-chloroindolyl phosphate hydrolysis family protein [Geminicoccaceae bacterium]HRY25479.1 5-bromo-4-chloroindolyl phosphate hydrolysis family protein [Geminicoccaceae bacterium]
MSEPTSEFARRIGSRVAEPGPGGSTAMWSVSHPIALHIATFFAVGPLVTGLMLGQVGKALGGLGAIAALQAAAWLIRKGRLAEREYAARTITRAPPPRKLAGTALVGLAAFSLSALGAGQPVILGLVAAALMGFAAYLTYGLDPRADKGLDAKLADRAGLKTEAVLAALEEARAKVRTIEAQARGLHSRELKDRLARITRSAEAVLAQIEKDPGDLRRARRFLVTYLDGTRDVVSGYRAQQQDLADTPLADNFRHVLETVERVFEEQREILKRNESLDLEVQIEVLKTQLEREGVH